MKYHELQTNTVKKNTRVGRGIAAGKGKTAGRGTKGQNARTGGGVRPGFEGGQNPLYMRLPKLPGFRAIKPAPEVIYTGQLEQFSGKTADNQSVFDAGLVSSAHVRVKLVVKGELTKKVTVKLQAASASAVKQIEKAGGTFTMVDRLPRKAKEKVEK
jgi:large subunit ribosomal protein L15